MHPRFHDDQRKPQRTSVLRKTLRGAAGVAAGGLLCIGVHAQVTLQTLATPFDTSAMRYNNNNAPGAACWEGFAPVGVPGLDGLSHRPASGGRFWTVADLARWRSNIASRRFVSADDFVTGSPADYTRVQANARGFVAAPEASLLTDANAGTLGSLARDAALVGLIEAQPTYRRAAAQWVLAVVRTPQNDFSGHCWRYQNNKPTPTDAYGWHGSFLSRIALVLDTTADQVSDDERLEIENYLRKMAWFHAAHMDWGVGFVFPNRNHGDYNTRASAAKAATDAEKYLSNAMPENCPSSGSASGTSYPRHTHISDSGVLGNRISVLSQWFNNRRAQSVMGMQAVGHLVGDLELVNRAKRYHMEWLSYGVYADGSQGEYARNGDYCIPQQGLIYAQSNVQSALFLASWTARDHDFDLMNYSTRDGAFGTETPTGGTPKSLSLVAQTVFDVRNGVKPWYLAEGWKGSAQAPRAATFLGALQTNYFGTIRDGFHELGMLAAADAVPEVKVACNILRGSACTTVRFPGTAKDAAGRPVGVDNGSWPWTDVMNFAPSSLLMR